MKNLLSPLLLAIFLAGICSSAQAELYITVVQGLNGAPEYQEQFDQQSSQLTAASNSITSADRVFTLSNDKAQRASLLQHFENLAQTMTNDDRAVIYLVGHGSYDGEQYKFNIPGPDITAEDLSAILNDFPGQNHFLVNTSSSSGAIIEPLESDSHIIVTATRNGNEKNATEFGTFFAEALASEVADINKNNNVSIQEAFDFAERGVADFFKSSGKLATEHPQIRGEGAAQYSLARVSEVMTTSSVPKVNQLLEERIAIDTQIEELQLRRGEYSNSDYIQRLQALILEAATVSEEINLLSQQAGENGEVQ